ncbi:hypothetical protein JYK14_17480 [Siccirubricoccus sp. KC 17139]|uniref:Uncharacterized protein n=1 Tax=Siccirubricoccus soli TaxID=2899147 RepID=A0ABT1D9K0_9PROT|nr:hypothetical protein [Siccirubricoccus soli]MCO6417940.1 hypothetical protein [Siccirubricoccus soli]MCP2684075.1 hypothetical protein [Siccirubricoccus soli]
MADLKVKISIKYLDRYDGKFSHLFKNLLELPTFTYDKMVKTEDNHVTLKDIEKDFDKASHGIFGTISYVVDEVLKENKITAKGNVPPSALKPAQAQLNKELAPYKKSLTKLMDATIDELCGADQQAPEGYDPKDDKATPKFLATMEKIRAILKVFQGLDQGLRDLKPAAESLTGPKAPPLPPKGGKDEAWIIKVVDPAEKLVGTFQGELKNIQKWMKARPPSLQAQKPATKESPAQKAMREAMNDLVECFGKYPKRIDEISTEISETNTLLNGWLTLVRAGRADFRLAKWPSGPDIAPSWNKLEALNEETGKLVDKIRKLAA